MSKKHLNLFQRLWHSWCVDVSESGRALILAGLIAMTLGSTTTYIDTYLLVGFLACLGFVSIILIFLYRPNVQISTTLPSRVIAGQSFPFAVIVKNLAKHPVRDAIIHSVEPNDPIEFQPKEQTSQIIAPHTTMEFFFTAQFSKRGIFHFSGFWVDTMFPFAWLRMGNYHDPSEKEVIVYPHFTALQELKIPTGRKYQPGGVAFASKLSDSTEYIGNREYSPGDRLREIDWHSWARLGIPIVREYQEEYFCRMALIVDTELTNQANPQRLQDFESMISLSAAITDYLSHQEYLLDIFAAGKQVYIVEAGRSLAHFENVLEVLACLEPSRQSYLETIEPILEERAESFTSIILLVSHITPEKNKFIEKWQQFGVGVKVIVCHSEPANVVAPASHPYLHFQIRCSDEIQAGISIL